MGFLNDDRIRFVFIKKENGKVFYRDTEFFLCPFIIVDIEKMESLIRPIKTTRDLMDVEATLFSSEKDAMAHLIKKKEEIENGEK